MTTTLNVKRQTQRSYHVILSHSLTAYVSFGSELLMKNIRKINENRICFVLSSYIVILGITYSLHQTIIGITPATKPEPFGLPDEIIFSGNPNNHSWASFALHTVKVGSYQKWIFQVPKRVFNVSLSVFFSLTKPLHTPMVRFSDYNIIS